MFDSNTQILVIFISHFDVEQEGEREFFLDLILEKCTSCHIIMLPTDEPLDQPVKFSSAFRLDKILLNDKTD